MSGDNQAHALVRCGDMPKLRAGAAGHSLDEYSALRATGLLIMTHDRIANAAAKSACGENGCDRAIRRLHWPRSRSSRTRRKSPQSGAPSPAVNRDRRRRHNNDPVVDTARRSWTEISFWREWAERAVTAIGRGDRLAGENDIVPPEG